MADERMGDVSNGMTVAICTAERHGLLADLVAAVRAQDAAEVLIVDNSADQAKAAEFHAEAAWPEGVRVLTSTPPNLSRARNLAVAECKTPHIAFIDDDATPEAGWIAGLLEGFSAGARVGAVGGPVEPVWPEGARPDWLPESLEPLLSRIDAGDTAREMEAGVYVFGCNFALSIEAAREGPGFPEHLGRAGSATLLSCEELEVQDALREAGWSVRYAPAARVRHRVHALRLSRNWLRARMAWQAVSEAMQTTAAPDRERVLNDLRRLSLQLGLAPALHALFNDAPPETFAAQVQWLHAFFLAILSAQSVPEGRLRTLCENEETAELREALRRARLENERLRSLTLQIAAPGEEGFGARLRRAWLALTGQVAG